MPAVPDHKNRTWLRPLKLHATTPGRPVKAEQDSLDRAYQARWYKLEGLQAGDDVAVTLTMPAGETVDYSLLGYTDIRDKARALLAQLTSRGPLDADDMDSDDMDSDDMDSDDMDSDDMDSDDMDSDDMDSDDMDSDDMDSDDMDSEDINSDDMDSDDMDSGDIGGDAPAGVPASTNYVDYHSVYASAQRHSLRAASITPGPADEQIHMTARAGGGSLYFRVRGHHGAFARGKKFSIWATVTREDACVRLDQTLRWTPIPAERRKGRSTLILTHTGRLVFETREDRTRFNKAVREFADRVNGLVWDLNDDLGLERVYRSWTRSPKCVPQANVVVDSIRSIVQDVATDKTLKYVVLVGGDDVIPFARAEDRAEISREWKWAGPYPSDQPLGATLTYGFYLTDDPYGRGGPLDPRGKSVRAPDLAVGRLVESSKDIASYLEWFNAGGWRGVRVDRALVSGYTFVKDLATHIADPLSNAGARIDRLIRDDWTAADLAALLPQRTANGGRAPAGDRLQLVAAQGHYSAHTLVPALERTASLRPDDPAIVNGDLEGTVWMTIGCHSGHNVVDREARPGYRHKTSWAEALLPKGTTLIGGTGFQYADSVLLENSERLYTYLAEEIAAAKSMALGDALLAAKRRYLTQRPLTRGLEEKLLAVSTLYGAPMLPIRVDTPQPLAAIPPSGSHPVPTPEPQVHRHDITIDGYTLDAHVTDGDRWWSAGASDNVIARPLRPVLPKVVRNISVAGLRVAGLIWIGGGFRDFEDPRPLIARPVTEADPRKPKYRNRAFLPVRPFHVSRAAPGQTLVLTPMQYDYPSKTARLWRNARLTIYYSDRTDVTALHDAPLLEHPRVLPTASGLEVMVRARHYASATEHVEVFVSFIDGGELQTVPLAAGVSTADGVGFVRPFHRVMDAPSDRRVFFQAVGGNGRVSSLTNGGAMFGVAAGGAPAATRLLLKVTKNAKYRDRIAVEARLEIAATHAPVRGDVLFRLGGSRIWKTTVAGVARATLTVATRPRDSTYLVVASFAGLPAAAPAAASQPLSVAKADTELVLPHDAPTLRAGARETIATLRMRAPVVRPMGERPVVLIRDDAEYHTYTDANGDVRVEPRDIGQPTAGDHRLTVYFEGDERYADTKEDLKLTIS